MIDEPALERSLAMLAEAMRDEPQGWWIISSAAVHLLGGDPGTIGDVDVLLDRPVAERTLSRLGLPLRAGEGTGQFRSALFGQWDQPPLCVELFADFEVCAEGRWEAVRPLTRQIVDYRGLRLPVPDRAEMIAMLRRFGRPKDLARATTLT